MYHGNFHVQFTVLSSFKAIVDIPAKDCMQSRQNYDFFLARFLEQLPDINNVVHWLVVTIVVKIDSIKVKHSLLIERHEYYKSAIFKKEN